MRKCVGYFTSNRNCSANYCVIAPMCSTRDMMILRKMSTVVLALVYITLLRVSLAAGTSNSDSINAAPIAATTTGESVELELRRETQRLDLSNTTYVDNNDYAYILGTRRQAKGNNNPNGSLDIVPEDREEDAVDDQGTNACVTPVVHNGVIRGDIYYGPDSRPAAEYACNDGYNDVGNGFVRCDDIDWRPPLNSLCRRMCPPLASRVSFGQTENSEVVLEPASSSSNGPGSRSSSSPIRMRFRCRSPDLRPSRPDTLLECADDGNWVLVDSNGQPSRPESFVKTADDLCVPHFKDPERDLCYFLPPRSGLSIRYKRVNGKTGKISAGDEAIVTCSRPNYVFRSRQHDTRAIYHCLPNGRWSNDDDFASLSCVPAAGCPRPISDVQLRPVFEQFRAETIRRKATPEADVPAATPYGTRLFYTCVDSERYYLAGDKEYFCNTNGSWTPHFWPRCERKKRCTASDFPSDGFYNGFDGADGFEPGLSLNFGCADGYRLEGHADIKCLENGEWNFKPPNCVRDEWSTKRFIAVSSVACLLGVLLVVILGFFLQRQLLLRKALGAGRRHRLLDSNVSDSRLRLPAVVNSSSHVGIRGGSHHHHHLHHNPQLLASAARTGPAAFDSDPDRLGLIAFADGTQVPLPTYEEAVSQAISERRCHPPPFDAISTLSGYCSRAIRRLPSLSSLHSTRGGDANHAGGLLGESPNARATSSDRCGTTGQQRPRFRAQWSSTSGSNVSSTNSNGQRNRHIGSNETVAVSDVSTNVTLETVSTGGQSQSASARAYAGSLSSVHSGGVAAPSTMVPIGAPLPFCSASSVASSSVGGVSSGCSLGMVSTMTGSQTEGLPLLESDESDMVQENDEVSCLNDAHNQQQQPAVDISDEIRSQKSLD